MPKSTDDPFQDSELTTILVVSDINRSKSFYIDQLGAELYREYGGTSVVIRLLTHWILLVTGGEPTADKPTIEFKTNPDPNTVSHSYTIRVKDCQKSYEILSARGIQFITPPYDWGAEIRCFFQDPDGHLLEISEYKG
ncbi:MAG: VOC family protein [Calditrichaeota bacterium]|nr:VOC family protein [Calditrichota bacterium]